MTYDERHEEANRIVSLSEEELRQIFPQANFGDSKLSDVVKSALLKCASGYHQGYTSGMMVQKLGLITEKTYKLTKLGQVVLWKLYSKHNVRNV